MSQPLGRKEQDLRRFVFLTAPYQYTESTMYVKDNYSVRVGDRVELPGGYLFEVRDNDTDGAITGQTVLDNSFPSKMTRAFRKVLMVENRVDGGEVYWTRRAAGEEEKVDVYVAPKVPELPEGEVEKRKIVPAWMKRIGRFYFGRSPVVAIVRIAVTLIVIGLAAGPPAYRFIRSKYILEDPNAGTELAIDLARLLTSPDNIEESFMLVLTNKAQKDVYRSIWERAEVRQREELAKLESAYGRNSDEVAQALTVLGTLLMKQGRPLEAEDAFREAFGILSTIHGADSEAAIQAMIPLAQLKVELNAVEEAEELHQKIEKYVESIPESVEKVDKLTRMALSERDMGRMDKAEGYMREALQVAEKLLPPGDRRILRGRMQLAEILSAAGRGEDALDVSRDGLKILDDPDVPPREKAFQKLHVASLLPGGDEKDSEKARLIAEAMTVLREIPTLKDVPQETIVKDYRRILQAIESEEARREVEAADQELASLEATRSSLRAEALMAFSDGRDKDADRLDAEAAAMKQQMGEAVRKQQKLRRDYIELMPAG